MAGGSTIRGRKRGHISVKAEGESSRIESMNVDESSWRRPHRYFGPLPSRDDRYRASAPVFVQRGGFLRWLTRKQQNHRSFPLPFLLSLSLSLFFSLHEGEWNDLSSDWQNLHGNRRRGATRWMNPFFSNNDHRCISPATFLFCSSNSNV